MSWLILISHKVLNVKIEYLLEALTSIAPKLVKRWATPSPNLFKSHNPFPIKRWPPE